MKNKLPIIILSSLLFSCGQANSAKATSTITVYFAPDDAFKSGCDNLKINAKVQQSSPEWATVAMTATEKTYQGRTIYSGSFEAPYNGADILQFQAYSGDTWQRQCVPFETYTSSDEINGKLLPINGDNTFIEYTYDADITKGSVIYLDTKNWDVENVEERYAAFFYNGTSSEWVNMTQEAGSVYKVVAPEGYTTLIFCRMNGSEPENNWNNKWNQTANFYSSSITNNIFVISNSSSEGAWKKYSSIENIFGLADNNYTRTTTINFTSDGYNEAVSVNKYKDGFSQTRTTTWIDGALYMTNGDKVNSGYFTSKEDGHMHHFKFDGESHPVSSADNIVIDDGYAADAGVNEFFANNDNNACSMHYLNQNKDTLSTKFVYDTSKAASDTVSYYTKDKGIINRLLAICAPCYLNTPTDERESYIIVTTATVVLNADNTIEIALWCDSDDSVSRSRLNEGSNKFAWAIISDIGTSAIPSIVSYIQ